MAAVAGYSHVAICVSNVEESRHFYGEQLGLETVNRPDFGFPGEWYVVGTLQLHLMQRENDAGAGEGIGPHFALYIPREDFHSEVERLREAGVEVMVEPNHREIDDIWAAFCKDPDGNIIELTDMGPQYLTQGTGG